MHQQPPQPSAPDDVPTGPVDAVNKRFFRLLGDGGGPLLIVWGLFCVGSLFLTLASAGIQLHSNAPMLHEVFSNIGDPQAMIDQQRAMQEQSFLSNYAGLLLYPLILLLMTVYYGTLNAIREVDTRGGEVAASEAISLVFSRFLPTGLATIVFFLGASLGGACCVIPGFIAMFFLYSAPYLAATGRSVGDAVTTSIEWSKRHWLLVLLICAVATVAGIGNFVLQFVSLSTFHGMLGDTGIIAGSLVTWAMGCVVGYFMWLYTGSVMVTIHRAESNTAPNDTVGSRLT